MNINVSKTKIIDKILNDISRSKILVGSCKGELSKLLAMRGRPHYLLPLISGTSVLDLIDNNSCAGSSIPVKPLDYCIRQNSSDACLGLYHFWPYDIQGIVIYHSISRSPKSELKVKF